MLYKLYSRRDFVKTLALGGAAYSLGCAGGPESYVAPIGVQLYSVRHVIFDDFEGTINKIAAMGYKGVETWGGLSAEIDLQTAAKTITDAGLQVFACHCDLPVGENKDVALQMAEAYQSDRLIFWGGSKQELFADDEKIKNTIETYNNISREFKKTGVKFGLHNHSWEFENTESGIIPFFYYLENLNTDIFFEIDTYWAKKGGYDPSEAIKIAGSRVQLLHIKDGAAEKGAGKDIHIPVGKGTLDFPAIASAGGRNIQWMVVEFDEAEMDIFDGLQQSYNYLIQNRLAKGNI